MMDKHKPITVGELITLLGTFPADMVLKVYKYAEDFDMNQDTRVQHLTAVTDEGFVSFGFTDLDYSLDSYEGLDEGDLDVHDDEPDRDVKVANG
jgi:hypothetical protein